MRRCGFGPELARCELEAGLDAGWTLAEAACRVAAAEEEAACAEAATRCAAVDACPYDDSGCGAAAGIPDDVFFDAYDACVERELVGPALGCRPEPAPDASSATGAGVFAGTTVGAGDDSTPSCGERVDYADVAHEWVAPADGTYRFDTDGSAGEFVLEVRSDCDGPALGCDYWDGSSGARNRVAVVDVDVRAGDRLVVIVDTPFDSTAGPYVVNVGDWGAVERCRSAADAMAATCRGDGARTCQAGAYADACAEGARPDLLADAIDCLEAESDFGSCRTFSDPSGARDCVRDVYASVSDARVDAIVADLGARCGRTYEGWDTASPLLSRTAADLLAIEDCVAAATTCREAVECTAVPSILACHE